MTRAVHHPYLTDNVLVPLGFVSPAFIESMDSHDIWGCYRSAGDKVV